MKPRLGHPIQILFAGTLIFATLSCTAPVYPTLEPPEPMRSPNQIMPNLVEQEPPPKPEPDRNETTQHMTMKLARVLPSEVEVPDSVMRIERVYTVASTYSPYAKRWTTNRRSQFAGKGILSATHGDMRFEFGVSEMQVSTRDYTTKESAVFTSPLALSILVHNQSSSGVELDWNAVSLIDKTREIYPVIHEGVKLSQRGSPMSTVTIPPDAVLKDMVYPRDLIFLSSGEWGSSWVGPQFIELMDPDSTLTLYLPVRQGDDLVEYQFIFEIGGPLE